MAAGAQLRDDRNNFHHDVPEFSAYWSSRPLSATLRKYGVLRFLACACTPSNRVLLPPAFRPKTHHRGSPCLLPRRKTLRIFIFFVACAGVLACWSFLPNLPARFSGANKQPLHSFVAVSACLLHIYSGANEERNGTELAGVKLRVGSAWAEPSGPMEASSEQTVGSLCHYVEYQEPVRASGVYFELAEHLSPHTSYRAVADIVLLAHRVHGAGGGDALSALSAYMLDEGFDRLLASSLERQSRTDSSIRAAERIGVVETQRNSAADGVETDVIQGRALVDVKRGWDGVDRMAFDLLYETSGAYTHISLRSQCIQFLWLGILVMLWMAFLLSLMARVQLTKIAICAAAFAGGLAWAVDVLFPLPYLVSGNDWDSVNAAVDFALCDQNGQGLCAGYLDHTPRAAALRRGAGLSVWVIVLVRFAQFVAHFWLVHSLWSERMILVTIIVNFFLSSLYESVVSLSILRNGLSFALWHLPMPLCGVIFPVIIWAMQRRTKAAITTMVQVRPIALRNL